jgi:DNA ligase-4
MAKPSGLGQLSSCETECFHKLCQFWESLHLKKKEDKLATLEKYIKRFDLACDLYPLFRLLLPGIDHERGAYGLKESNLAKLYGEMLGLPEGQKQRLLRWKDPALQEGYKCAAGDFSSVLFSVVESRVTIALGSSRLTIGDVNICLDRIHNAGDMVDKRTQLLELVRRASANEQKWLVKLILKDLKIGFSHESVLKRFHPNAMELYNRSSMLKQVLDDIRTQYTRAEAGESGVKADGVAGSANAMAFASTSAPFTGESIIFSKFKPMLAQRLPLDKVTAQVDGSKTFLVETKYDGERMIVHVDRDTNRLELYSRNAIDYTSQYAPTMRNIFFDGILGRQVVLDGEMLAWDKVEEAYVPFGHNRTVARGNDPNRHLCYVAFDVLFYMDKDGEFFDLRRTRLEGRRELLSRIVEPQANRLEVATSILTSSAADIQSRLEGAVDQRQEGIVIKDAGSRYYFNARKKGWFKLKPEYDGLADTLDLLVVGAYFGDSQKRRAGQGESRDLADNVAQFLLAARKGDGTEGDRIISVCRVGTGFSMEQLREIRDRIRPHIRRYDPRRAPAWLGGWRGAGKAKPDVILDSPAHGFVMEIRAAEIIPSDEFELGHTLRFPRAVVPIREDKDWNDAATENDLKTFLQGGRGVLTSKRVRPKVEVRSDGEDTDDEQQRARPSKRRRSSGGGAVVAGRLRCGLRRGPSFGVIDGFRETDTSNVPVASQLLRGAEIFVIGGDRQYTKADLEAYVVQHGGKCMQNYIRGRTSLVIGSTMDDLRTRNLARTARADIAKYSYLFECESSRRMLPLQPRCLLSKSPETEVRFAAAFDEYGDALYESVTPEQLQQTLEDIPADRLSSVQTLARHPRFGLNHATMQAADPPDIGVAQPIPSAAPSPPSVVHPSAVAASLPRADPAPCEAATPASPSMGIMAPAAVMSTFPSFAILTPAAFDF